MLREASFPTVRIRLLPLLVSLLISQAWSFDAGAQTSTIAFVQTNYAVPQTPQATVRVAYTAPQTLGDLNVVLVGWNDATSQVLAVTDTSGNSYLRAIAPTVQPGVQTHVIYYASNIGAAAANANTVTVTFNAAASYPDVRIAEYRGIDPVDPVEAAAGAYGSGSTSSSGAVNASANGLLVAGNVVQSSTSGPGSGFTQRVITSPNGSILEDRAVTTAGGYTATATVNGSSGWVMQVVAFRGASGGTPPSGSSVRGQWRTLPYLMPLNPVHIALTRTGKVLVVAGSGNVATVTDFRAAVWDPQADTIFTQPIGWDMFCNGMVALPDGRIFINGGNLKYDPFWGQPRNAIFDPTASTFTDVENMAHGRWYPTVTALGDGRIMTFSGLSETGATNTTVEIYTAGAGWSQQYQAGWTPPLYPRMHLLHDGRVAAVGPQRQTRIFDPATKTWSAGASTIYTSSRTYGTSVLLPLRPAAGYKSRIMILGGGNPSTATTEIIDMSAATPQWQSGPSMSQPRIEMSATILPNGKVLAIGGSLNDEDASTASLNADLYDPTTGGFSSAGANVYPRLYHSGSLLLPDATVMLVGGNPTRGSYQQQIEIYSPAYLFNADGSAAVRPTITSVTPDTIGYGDTFQVSTPDAANIGSVALIRPGAATHAIDMDQRMVELAYTKGSGVLTVTAPPNGNIAPPGYYMLFVLNAAGVPSVASFVRLGSGVGNQPPVATITSPASNVTVNPGQSVSFAGSGTDADGTIAAYSWSFPGGTPSSSTVAAPGAVTYSTPGTYTASLKVTDDAGASSTSATRTVTVVEFSLSASPSSRSVSPGGSTTYSASVTPGTGFTGTVTFSVTGLPAGTTASFNPTSVNTSGQTTLTVSTGTSTPAGNYPLTIRATSGTTVRTANVALVVVGDFSVQVSPSIRTITQGGATTYAATVTNLGFAGTVTFSVSGIPKFASAQFTPSSVVDAGTSTLSIKSTRRVATGTYTLTISGTGGGVTRSGTVTLTVQ